MYVPGRDAFRGDMLATTPLLLSIEPANTSDDVIIRDVGNDIESRVLIAEALSMPSVVNVAQQQFIPSRMEVNNSETGWASPWPW